MWQEDRKEQFKRGHTYIFHTAKEVTQERKRLRTMPAVALMTNKVHEIEIKDSNSDIVIRANIFRLST